MSIVQDFAKCPLHTIPFLQRDVKYGLLLPIKKDYPGHAKKRHNHNPSKKVKRHANQKDPNDLFSESQQQPTE